MCNLCDIGIIPFNYAMLKKDVPLLNIILNSSLFKITFEKYMKDASGMKTLFDKNQLVKYITSEP